jgi:Uma2 family endonuclease
MSVLPLQRDLHYPESDGKPLGETETHFRELFDLLAAFDGRFGEDPNVWVGGNQFLYYVEGDPRKVICPDFMVTVGIPKLPHRNIYKLWVEGRPPSLIVEITSDSTRHEDLSTKKALYERLRVAEYFLHDPLGDWLEPPLQGFRLIDGKYRPIEPDEEGALTSRVTGLKFQNEEGCLRLTDAATGERLLNAAEERLGRLAAEQRVRDQEEELLRLRRELGRG